MFSGFLLGSLILPRHAVVIRDLPSAGHRAGRSRVFRQPSCLREPPNGRKCRTRTPTKFLGRASTGILARQPFCGLRAGDPGGCRPLARLLRSPAVLHPALRRAAGFRVGAGWQRCRVCGGPRCRSQKAPIWREQPLLAERGLQLSRYQLSN